MIHLDILPNRLALCFRLLKGLVMVFVVTWKRLIFTVPSFRPPDSVKKLLLARIREVRSVRVLTPALRKLEKLIDAAISELLILKGTVLGLTVVKLALRLVVCRVWTLLWTTFPGTVA